MVKPPYGRITAYNMNKGDIAWQIPNGDTPPAVKDNPALKGMNMPKTGSPSQAGCWSRRRCCSRARARAARPILHAYDKKTGAEIWRTPLPGPQTGLPMTYMHQGRQFIVLGVRGAQGGAAQLTRVCDTEAGGSGAGAGGGRGRGAGPGGAPAGEQ